MLHPEIGKRAISVHYVLLDAVAAEDVEKACKVQYDHIELLLKAFELEVRRD